MGAGRGGAAATAMAALWANASLYPHVGPEDDAEGLDGNTD